MLKIPDPPPHTHKKKEEEENPLMGWRHQTNTQGFIGLWKEVIRPSWSHDQHMVIVYSLLLGIAEGGEVAQCRTNLVGHCHQFHSPPLHRWVKFLNKDKRQVQGTCSSIHL